MGYKLLACSASYQFLSSGSQRRLQSQNHLSEAYCGGISAVPVMFYALV